jgi:hypothetical protein
MDFKIKTFKAEDHRAGLLTALAISLVFAVANFAFDRKPTEFDMIVARAERVFHFDDTYQKILPPNQVVALSLAIKFGNEEGARLILSRLEPQMQSTRF